MQQISIELEHITLAGLEFGNADKPLLIALHGWLDNAASFIPLAPYLKDFHIIAIDWPGHGHSMHRGVDASYQLIDYVYDLFALSQYIKREYGLDKLNIMAHSLGGIVTSIFSGTFPERVDKIAMIESFGPLTQEPEQCVESIRKSISAQYRKRGRDGKMPIHPDKQSAIIARTNAADFGSDIATLLVERGLMPAEHGYTWRSDQRLRNLSPVRLTEEQAQAILSNINAPVLSVMGTSGMEFALKSLTTRQSLVRNLTTVHVNGGHHVHMEQPEQVAQAITKFFKVL